MNKTDAPFDACPDDVFDILRLSEEDPGVGDLVSNDVWFETEELICDRMPEVLLYEAVDNAVLEAAQAAR